MPHRPPQYPQLRSRNRKGDIAEMAFLTRAMRFGFNVCKPLNTDCSYDVLVEVLGHYSRVQVKSAWTEKGGWGTGRVYSVRVCRAHRHKRQFYSADDTDFFAAYVAAEDAWYIIPREVVASQTDVGLFPHIPNSRGHLEIYREAWDLLVPRGIVIKELKAMADTCALAPEDSDRR